MKKGTADHLPWPDNSFDIVIFGFCLYLCDRNDLFRIAAETNRVLRENGHIAVYDFYTETPYRNPYSHYEGLYSYKMDHSRLFSWNPAYHLVSSRVMPHPSYNNDAPDYRAAITVLKKDSSISYPDNPYAK